MTKSQAEELIRSVDALSDSAFKDLLAKWHKHQGDDFDSEYAEIRSFVLEAFMSSKKSASYETDLNVGLCLYELMNPSNGFTLVMANDDDFWRYLSCKVFPDITYERYPKPAQGDVRLNSKRFYSHTRRIWLKTLWWYVYLAWQGSVEETRVVLSEFGSDTISDFIERTGYGYRVGFYRVLMKEYASLENKSSKLFNAIQKQSRVYCRTVEPSLVEGAEVGYVRSLFRQLSIGGTSDVS